MGSISVYATLRPLPTKIFTRNTEKDVYGWAKSSRPCTLSRDHRDIWLREQTSSVSTRFNAESSIFQSTLKRHSPAPEKSNAVRHPSYQKIQIPTYISYIERWGRTDNTYPIDKFEDLRLDLVATLQPAKRRMSLDWTSTAGQTLLGRAYGQEIFEELGLRILWQWI